MFMLFNGWTMLCDAIIQCETELVYEWLRECWRRMESHARRSVANVMRVQLSWRSFMKCFGTPESNVLVAQALTARGNSMW